MRPMPLGASFTDALTRGEVTYEGDHWLITAVTTPVGSNHAFTPIVSGDAVGRNKRLPGEMTLPDHLMVLDDDIYEAMVEVLDGHNLSGAAAQHTGLHCDAAVAFRWRWSGQCSVWEIDFYVERATANAWKRIYRTYRSL